MSMPADLESLWRRAVDRWSSAIALALPVAIPDPEGAIAYIDLATRAGGYEGWMAATTEVFASVAGPRPAPAPTAAAGR